MSVYKFFALTGILSASLLGACTEEGKPIAHATFHLDTVLVGEQAATGSTFNASNGDQVRIDSLEIEIESIELISGATSSGKAVEFDPANPPAPFTNCHAGHCHSTESDATFTFDEIKKILADKASGKAVVFSAEVDKKATLKSLNETVSLANIASGDLNETTLSEFRIKLGEIHFKGHNVTKNAAISASNHHEGGHKGHDHHGNHKDHEGDHKDHHGDHKDHDKAGHEHIDTISLSLELSKTIDAKSAYEQEFHGVISVDASFISDIVTATGDIDFADVLKEHLTLKAAH